MKKTQEPGVLVIGAGVAGLTTALCLAEKNFRVTIVADRFAPNLTSVVAGALWEWPPAVCGYHHDQISLSRSKDWCMTSYDQFFDLAERPETGVHIRPVLFFFRQPVNNSPRDLHKMLELKDKIKGFRHDKAMISEEEINPHLQLKDAYCHLAPMVDTDQYMHWLLRQVKLAGCDIRQQKITGLIAEQEQQLRDQFNADFIVNCSGLGASELAGESMYPLRGALVRVKNDGKKMPKITKAYCISHDESSNNQDIIFIVPRGNNMLVLGGLAEKDEWSTDIGLHNHEPVQQMYERCCEFMPILRQAEIDETEPVRVGLRPFRNANVRLEKDPNYPLIHNYAHGGAGVTFSWGCAREVSDMVQQYFYASVTAISA
ncbi:FAD-binding oxidoreductase [Pseudoflavitalea sp. G-6-1-2]|uniref:FAD-dependent oxidoreductase n=1 Tax=Pseudoflavitalea sp. G-6-1-2 TaxID=2728841 RepID=UPI00146A26D4|nr:FAD-dependent oxidoreductase [Pseudoflavitalea sp. G-6-1-2]NML20722.1 FAD-binding oxidoreductase [Pseudoflavitalea sp. G-6-1-2]